MDWQESAVPPRVKTAAIVIIVASVWAFISPFVLHYNHIPHAIWTTMGIGMVSALIVGLRVSGAQQAGWMSLLNALFGILLIIAPFVRGDASHLNIVINDVVIGAIITAFAIWAFTGTRSLVSHPPTAHHA